MVLSKMKEIAESYIGYDVKQAVVTVYFICVVYHIHYSRVHKQMLRKPETTLCRTWCCVHPSPTLTDSITSDLSWSLLICCGRLSVLPILISFKYDIEMATEGRPVHAFPGIVQAGSVKKSQTSAVTFTSWRELLKKEVRISTTEVNTLFYCIIYLINIHYYFII